MLKLKSFTLFYSTNPITQVGNADYNSAQFGRHASELEVRKSRRATDTNSGEKFLVALRKFELSEQAKQAELERRQKSIS